jgi:hypothetical protein
MTLTMTLTTAQSPYASPDAPVTPEPTASITVPPFAENIMPLPHYGPTPDPQPLGTAPVGQEHNVMLCDSPAHSIEPMPVPAIEPLPTPEQIGKAFLDWSRPRVTRLKMTLHYVDPLPNDGTDNPLTRCTFGAVYSANKAEEDFVYGKATPFGNLQYNVRSDQAEHLVVGKAYYIDIQAVPD